MARPGEVAATRDVFHQNEVECPGETNTPTRRGSWCHFEDHERACGELLAAKLALLNLRDRCRNFVLLSTHSTGDVRSRVTER